MEAARQRSASRALPFKGRVGWGWCSRERIVCARPFDLIHIAGAWRDRGLEIVRTCRAARIADALPTHPTLFPDCVGGEDFVSVARDECAQVSEPLGDFLAQPRHRERKFVAAPRRLAEPER